MARSSLAQVARVARLGLRAPPVARISSPSFAAASSFSQLAPQLLPSTPIPTIRFISNSPNRKGITPDDKPPAPKDVDIPPVVRTAAEITDDVYHSVADEYMDRLVTHLEGIQDEREDIDVEYSAGVLTVRFGPEIGTYVINKQPPNKQIWLSSPKTGPKRYDYVVLGDGQHEKQDTACGEWLYLRDNSTMTQLFKDELGIDISMPVGSYGE
ncbi:Frataxin-like domain-containing protein [Podospora didyma]|uniref:ferroxidase n=1 Tax=Podospora didyma TaxID=330526 RepID=A0AAE0NRW7_9PEZI|nr:Frataxin-like domain-containing protein [Podospora didyma]